MKCPVCNVDLLISERQGVEIDHCPQCRGVWLDRGELDKIIDRSMGMGGHTPTAPAQVAPAPPPYAPPTYVAPTYTPPVVVHQEGGHHGGHHGGHRRGFLGELFD